MAFQKSNWTRTASAEKARVYVPAAISNIANTNFVQGTTLLTLTVPFEFQGPGQVEVSIPAGQTALNTNLSLAECQLISPASGSYSLGNHPRVTVKFVNSGSGNIVPSTTDLFLVQY
jgi:hypothetical protein